MDQIKIGKFIAENRKALSLTQRELAEKLHISDKAISKWETGNGLPEVSLMIPLCEALKINVNELLSGEKLNEAEYHKKAEENMMDLIKQKEESKKKIILSAVVATMCIISCTALILTAGMLTMPTAARAALIAAACIIVVMGIGVACVLDCEAGTFECPHCGERFVPEIRSYIAGAHTLTKRRLKCPKCGKTDYCRHRLTK